MQTKLSKAFDESLARIKRGGAVKACLVEYRHLLQQLVPLLHTALSIATVPKVSPSDEFRKLAKAHLMARLREMPIQTEKSSNALSVAWRILGYVIAGPARVAIPLTLALFLVLQGLFLFGVFNFSSSADTPVLASHSTLTTFDGSVKLKRLSSSTWEEAANGMTLEAGSRIQTASNSHAMLTFFNGTTVKLGPGTDLVIKQVEGSGEIQPIVIVLKQWSGKTWSRVTKLVDPGSHYEIQTPSASALVRGTLFVTEVDETGATTVQTIEGLVSVSAQGEEVYLPAGQQTAVEPGAPPTKPVPIGPTGGEGPPGEGQEGSPVQGPESEGPPGEGQGGSPAQGPEREGPTVQSQEGSSVQGSDSDVLMGQSQEGSPAQNPDSDVLMGQSQGGSPAQSPDSEQAPDYMWWMFLGVTLFSFGLMVFMWRRQ